MTVLRVDVVERRTLLIALGAGAAWVLVTLLLGGVGPGVFSGKIFNVLRCETAPHGNSPPPTPKPSGKTPPHVWHAGCRGPNIASGNATWSKVVGPMSATNRLLFINVFPYWSPQETLPQASYDGSATQYEIYAGYDFEFNVLLNFTLTIWGSNDHTISNVTGNGGKQNGHWQIINGGSTQSSLMTIECQSAVRLCQGFTAAYIEQINYKYYFVEMSLLKPRFGVNQTSLPDGYPTYAGFPYTGFTTYNYNQPNATQALESRATNRTSYSFGTPPQNTAAYLLTDADIEIWVENPAYIAVELIFRLLYLAMTIVAFIYFYMSARNVERTFEQRIAVWLFIGMLFLNNPFLILEHLATGAAATAFAFIEFIGIIGCTCILTFTWLFTLDVLNDPSRFNDVITFVPIRDGLKLFFIGVFGTLATAASAMTILGWSESPNFIIDSETSTGALVLGTMAGIVFAGIVLWMAYLLVVMFTTVMNSKKYLLNRLFLLGSVCIATSFVMLVSVFHLAVAPLQRSALGFMFIYSIYNASFVIYIFFVVPVDGGAGAGAGSVEGGGSESTSLLGGSAGASSAAPAAATTSSSSSSSSSSAIASSPSYAASTTPAPKAKPKKKRAPPSAASPLNNDTDGADDALL